MTMASISIVFMKFFRRETVAAALLGVVLAPGAVPAAAQSADAPTVLITGSNRGLGLEFTRQYAAKGWNVIATCRAPGKADALQALAAVYENIAIEPLDVSNHAMIDALSEKYRDRPIDVLLNNAGMSGSPSPTQVFGRLDAFEFDRYMRTNAWAPLIMSQGFIEQVKASGQKKIVSLSSLAGSFGAKSGGVAGLYYYKSSKAALNMIMVNLARELERDGVIVALISPGVVDTQGMIPEGVTFPGLVPIDESIGGLIDVVDGLTIEDTGKFIRYNGEEQPF